uniref:Uncharacterized protein n=1 Tax=Nelumbo nucifera TaxID=4432 RepID=A0A822XVP9_NELNU|nr:TPA_asm: hypothetical protein HUJ06_027181 [Nelumbo nucifera]
MSRKTEVCCLISILLNVSASMLLAIGMLLNFQGAWPIWIAPLTIPLWILGVPISNLLVSFLHLVLNQPLFFIDHLL